MSRSIVLLLTASCLHIVLAKSATGTHLRDENWHDLLEGEWMVKFYAPWCPACRNLEPTWTSLAVWAVDKGISVGEVDVTQEPGLSGRFIITSLPTIYHVINGEFRVYSGPRTLDDFLAFVNEKKWAETSPISWWKSPSSTMMGYVSKLFQFSMRLKNLHSDLTKAIGIPVWASFILFAVIVIAVGLLLGVILVVVTDLIFGPPEEKADAAEDTENEKELPSEQERTKEATEENTGGTKNREEAEQLRRRKTRDKATAD